MPKFNKTNDVLLFYDDFSETTLMWTLSPSKANCLSFSDNRLQIKHNKDYVFYTIVEPSIDEYSCVVKLDHIPQGTEDIAGVIILSDSRGYAECQSYIATESSEITNSNIDILKHAVQEVLDESNYVQCSLNDEKISINDSGSYDDGAAMFVDKIYPYIKFTKLKYKYFFYASEDGYTWIDVGNVAFDSSNSIGFFTYGTTDENILNNSHFFVDMFALYKSKYITINGIDRNYEIEIYDENRITLLRTDSNMFKFMFIRSNNQCLINTSSLPIPIKNAKLRVFSKYNYETTISSFELGNEVYGGDEFTIEKDISFFIDNKELNLSNIYDLGEFYSGSYYIKMIVRNNEEFLLRDVKIKIIRYSEYYSGEEAVGLALYDLLNENQKENDLIYSKEIVIESIKPQESCALSIKLIDKPVQDFYMTAKDYRFKIIVE